MRVCQERKNSNVACPRERRKSATVELEDNVLSWLISNVMQPMWMASWVEEHRGGFHLLAERFKITQDVGRYKAETGLPAADPEREARQVARLRALAEEAGLDPVFSEQFLRFIVAEVIQHHNRIADAG